MQASSVHSLILYAGLAYHWSRSLLQVFFKSIMSNEGPLNLLDPFLRYISYAAAIFSHLAVFSKNWSNLLRDFTDNYSCWWADCFNSNSPYYLSIKMDHTSNASPPAYGTTFFWVLATIWFYSLYKVVIGDGWRRGGMNLGYRWIHVAREGCILVGGRWEGLSHRCCFGICLVASEPSFNFKKVLKIVFIIIHRINCRTACSGWLEAAPTKMKICFWWVLTKRNRYIRSNFLRACLSWRSFWFLSMIDHIQKQQNYSNF